MKVYKLKFTGDGSNIEARTEKDDFMENLRWKYRKNNVLEEKGKSVIIKAKNKDHIRHMIDHAEAHAPHPISFGMEGNDYIIKKIADDEEEYERDI